MFKIKCELLDKQAGKLVFWLESGMFELARWSKVTSFRRCSWGWVAEVEMRLPRNCEAKVLDG